MAKIPLKYLETDSPREFKEATGLFIIFDTFLDGSLLLNVRDILNGKDWNSSLPVHQCIGELCTNTRFQELYNSFQHTSTAKELSGDKFDDSGWDFDPETIHSHKLIKLMQNDIILLVSFLFDAWLMLVITT